MALWWSLQNEFGGLGSCLGGSVHGIEKPAPHSSSARASSGRRCEKRPLVLFLEGVPSRQGWNTLTARVEKSALAEKLHNGSEEMGSLFPAHSSAPSRGGEGLLTAPLRAGELDAHA